MGNSKGEQVKAVQKWSSEMQRVVQPEERRHEARERTKMERHACSRKSSFTDGVSPFQEFTSVLSCSWVGEHPCILSGLGDCLVDGCSCGSTASHQPCMYYLSSFAYFTLTVWCEP